jgi:hypothetical protein
VSVAGMRDATTVVLACSCVATRLPAMCASDKPLVPGVP